jgi:prevent-host-death family protein
MHKEKSMPFVEARANLSELIDRVAEHGETYVIAKRQKPIAVIIGMERYQQLVGAAKHHRTVAGKRLLKIAGIAKATGDTDQAIRALRQSKLATARRSTQS